MVQCQQPERHPDVDSALDQMSMTIARFATIVGFIAASMAVITLVTMPVDMAYAQTTVSTPTTASTTDATYNLKSCQKAGVTSPVEALSCAISTVIISALAGITSVFTTLMDMSAALFNLAIQNTVIDFATIYQKVSAPATQAWTAIRDLANILIIGFFVFIAISIILGLQEYGQKKLIARVIIVATLINFSFLFTTIIINTSNYLAASIYESGIKPKAETTWGAGGATNGIAGKFKEAMGIASVRSGSPALWNELAKQHDSLDGNMWLHAFMIVIFSSIATLAFLFASFLLIARVVVLLFLLVFSAAAFATYLIPSLSSSSVGWGTWWQNLLKNSFFAPLLMLSLAVSLSFASGLSLQKNAALGAITVGDPAAKTGLESIIAYALVLGIFVLGVFVASSLANGAATRFAKLAPGLGIGATAAAGGILGRNSLGRFGAYRSHHLEDSIKREAKKQASRSPELQDLSRLKKLTAQKARYDALSKSSFDARGGMLGSMLKGAGVPAALSEAKKKSFADTTHHEAEEAVKTAMAGAIKKSDAEAMAKEKHKDARSSAEHEQSTARDEAYRARDASQRERDQHEAELQRLRTEEEDAKVEQQRARDDLKNLPRTATAEDKNAVQMRLQASTDRIRKAQDAARPLARSVRDAEQNAKRAEGRLKIADRQVSTVTDMEKSTAQEYLENNKVSTQKLATQKTGGFFVQAVRRASGGRVELKPEAAQHARDMIASRTGMKGAVAREKAEEDAAKKAFAPKESPAAPPPAAASGGGGAHH